MTYDHMQLAAVLHNCNIQKRLINQNHRAALISFQKSTLHVPFNHIIWVKLTKPTSQQSVCWLISIQSACMCQLTTTIRIEWTGGVLKIDCVQRELSRQWKVPVEKLIKAYTYQVIRHDKKKPHRPANNPRTIGAYLDQTVLTAEVVNQKGRKKEHFWVFMHACQLACAAQFRAGLQVRLIAGLLSIGFLSLQF